MMDPIISSTASFLSPPELDVEKKEERGPRPRWLVNV